MNKLLSVYFDALRVVCALLVFLYHAGVFWGGPMAEFTSALGITGSIAHLAVVVFFVLSGYLIRHASMREGVTWKTYAVDRAARLSSVVLPGLVLAAIAMLYIWLIKPE